MKQIAVIIGVILLFLGCNKDKPKPNEKFYCLINGTVFRPNSGGDVFNSPLYAEWNTKGWFNLYGFNFKNGLSVTMSAKLINKDVELGKYNAKDSLYYASYDGSLIFNSSLNRYEHEEFTSYEGSLEITKYDKTLKQISGTFEFVAKSKQTNNIVKVTKGQFNNVYVYQVF